MRLNIAETSIIPLILRPEPTAEQEPKLPNHIADASSVLVDILPAV